MNVGICILCLFDSGQAALYNKGNAQQENKQLEPSDSLVERVLFCNCVSFLMELVTHKSPPLTLICYTDYVFVPYYKWVRHQWRHIVCKVYGTLPPDD